MTDTETFQIPLEAAEVYEAQFVPAIFAQWAPLLLDAADVGPAHAVLDVGCGTGIVARTVADVSGMDGALVGVDLNPAMLTVARRLRPDLEWQHGDAGNLPFPGKAFDRVLCQMALMFFPDRARALAEMARVTTDDGVIAVVVPASITDQPAYGPLASVIADVAGSAAAALMDTYWSCGDLDELRVLFQSAGLRITAARTHLGTARFSSIEAMVATEVNGSPLAGRLDEAAYHRISRDAHDALRTYETPAGEVHAPLCGHIVAARKLPG